MTISQPVINASKFATFLGHTPRSELAESTFETRAQDLASRYFKAISDYVKGEESMQLSEAKITALTQQFKAAERMLAKGEGTVSDLRDS